MNAGRARELGQAHDAAFHLFAFAHHKIGQFVHDDDQKRHGLQNLGRVVDVRGRIVDRGSVALPGQFFVVARDVAHSRAAEQFVTTVHFLNGP